MSSPSPVVNISGDNPETILHLAKKLGQAKLRRDIFNLIYGRGEKPRSKRQIGTILNRPDEQAVQNELDHLTKNHLIKRSENAGQVKDRSRWLYGKDAIVKAVRADIVRYADNPSVAKRVPTKRRPLIEAPLSFVKPTRTKAKSSVAKSAKRKSSKRFRIAVLVTNPDTNAPLQTAIEARDIQQAILLGGKANEVDVKLILAPTLDHFLDMLNSFDPAVIHFSGHGGGRALVFDNERVGDDGGVVLDFDMVSRAINATSVRPRLIVLAACDTVDGADRFLDVASAVIAMADSIEDEAACEFSKRFYQSLSAGQSIKASLAQAKIVLEHKGYEDADLPTLITRDGNAGAHCFL